MGKSREHAVRPHPPKKSPKTRPTGENKDVGDVPIDRGYYRGRWGFDPVAEAQELGDGWQRLEAWFPLDHDPPLQASDVTIGARVDWRSNEVRNRIVFRRENTDVTVDCVHTIVFEGPAEVFFAQDNPEIGNTIRDERYGASFAKLPAVEHFAALKSFVAGIAEIGILHLSFAHGINNELLHQIRRAVKKIAPLAWETKILDRIAKIATEMGSKKLVHLFRAHPKLDKLQNNLFKNPNGIERVREFLPGVPWDQLQLEWQARRAIQHNIKASAGRSWNEEDMWQVPQVEVYPRGSLCLVSFQDELFSEPNLNSPTVARARLEQFFRRYTIEEKILAGGLRYDIQKLEDDIKKDPSTLLQRELDNRKNSALRESALMIASNPLVPADVVAFLALSPWQDVRERIAERRDLSPEILDQHAPDPTFKGKWESRRSKEPEVVPFLSNMSPELDLICNPLTHPDVLRGFTSHWDFRLRLALAARYDLGIDLLKVLTRDKQPSVRAIVQAHLNHGEKRPSFVPGQVLSPGEILWLLVAHPDKLYRFISLGEGDLSPEHTLWLHTLVERWPSPYNLAREIGREHVWSYINMDYNWGGCIYEFDIGDPIPIRHYLPLDGLRAIACGKLPCMLLECDVEFY